MGCVSPRGRLASSLAGAAAVDAVADPTYGFAEPRPSTCVAKVFSLPASAPPALSYRLTCSTDVMGICAENNEVIIVFLVSGVACNDIKQ